MRRVAVLAQERTLAPDAAAIPRRDGEGRDYPSNWFPEPRSASIFRTMKYDEDLYQWTIEQGRALRDRATNALDYDNLAEEIESLGRSDKREIESRLENLLVHLVKWRYQPEWRSPSWEASIDEARRRIERVIKDSPS